MLKYIIKIFSVKASISATYVKFLYKKISKIFSYFTPVEDIISSFFRMAVVAGAFVLYDQKEGRIEKSPLQHFCS